MSATELMDQTRAADRSDVPDPPNRRHRTAGAVAATLGRYVLLSLAAAVFLYPLVWMFLNSLRPGASIIRDPLGFDPSTASFDSYRAMLGSVPIGRAFFNTFVVLVGKGAITLIFCPLAGFAFAKYEFRCKRLLFGFVLVTLMLPTIVLIIPLLLQMSQMNWVNTFQALILPGSIDAFSIFWMRQVTAAVPDEILDAARIDGASEFGLFRRIVIPVIRPGLAALAVLTFIGIYNDFVWPVIVTNDEQHATLQVLLSTLSQNITSSQLGADFSNVWGQTLAASTLASLPVLTFFIVLQRHFVSGLLAGSGKT